MLTTETAQRNDTNIPLFFSYSHQNQSSPTEMQIDTPQ